ncbi:TPR REGION domain-containing protein [Citrus sinensis]|uniref:Uncharacterized protein n=1 Tax=Citrus clementina TaxID=85681 RepID=V4WJ48_CITCL|nr:hypothetical protein CICLE_v10010190mg [Citrus x clementina]KAH9654206.1 TPR REGION domain-containing protein [Citrus sinensis]
MCGAKPVSTPLCSTASLKLFDGATSADATEYRKVVGALQYLSFTRPDISFAVTNEAKLEGNKLFGEGKYEEALLQYEVALRVASVPERAELASAPEAKEGQSASGKKEVATAPEMAELRSICHSNRGICFLKLGKFEESIKECTKALELNPTYMKALIRRAEAHEKLEHFEEAIAVSCSFYVGLCSLVLNPESCIFLSTFHEMKKILEFDPSNNQAKRTILRLQPLAEEKLEKMKEEMIGKLKEMGNSILGRFGMSTNNFKAVKDPNTGTYSISFQK